VPAIFAEIGRTLQQRSLKTSAGTIVDRTIIAASNSTRDAMQPRDPGMKQTREGNPWHFDANCKFLLPFDLQRRTAELRGPVFGHGLRLLARPPELPELV
jgi:hypothetical protein